MLCHTVLEPPRACLFLLDSAFSPGLQRSVGQERRGGEEGKEGRRGRRGGGEGRRGKKRGRGRGEEGKREGGGRKGGEEEGRGGEERRRGGGKKDLEERRVKERGWIIYTSKYQQIDFINTIFIIIIRVAA